VNRRALAALLAAAPLALGVGAGTATAAPPAPPAAAITTPVDAAPAGSGATTFALAGMQRVVVLSCQPSPDRLAWAVPSTPGVVSWLQPPVAYISGSVPIIDTDSLGWPVELVALGVHSPVSVPVFRSGCFENHAGAAGGGQSQLTWGDPAQISSTTATGLKIINPAARPLPDTSLAILPGASGTDSPSIGSRPLTSTAAQAPASPAPASPAPTTAAPAYTGTTNTSASSQAASDTGGGTPWGAIVFGLLTLLFAAGSRATSWRVRKDFDADKIPARAYLYGGFAALAGLIAAASAPTSIGGFFGAAVLAVIVALVLSAQRAAVSGHRVSVVALVKTARTDWPGAGVGAAVGFIVGYIASSGVATPGVLYGLIAGAGVGIGAAHLRQTQARVAGWRVDAAAVADILNIPEKTITELGEVVFATTPDGGFQVTTLNQAARAHLDGIEDRCAAIAPHLMVVRADRLGVEVGPVDSATAAHREAMTGSGGLVGGAHAGADPWTGEAPTPAPDNGSVDMHKPSTTEAGPGVVDLSAGWD